jgi:hypothetical protein
MLTAKAPWMKRESEGKHSGIPHLAKNERDVGHPSVRRGEKLQSKDWLSYGHD